MAIGQGTSGIAGRAGEAKLYVEGLRARRGHGFFELPLHESSRQVLAFPVGFVPCFTPVPSVAVTLRWGGYTACGGVECVDLAPVGLALSDVDPRGLDRAPRLLGRFA